VIRRLTTVVVGVAAVGACALGANTSPVENSSESYPQPPQVRLLGHDDVSGLLVYQNWIVDGEWHEDQAPTWPDELPPARLAPGTPLIFELAAVGLPAWVDVSMFASIGPDGQPAGEPERIVCLPVTERAPCSVDLVEDRRILQITVRPAEPGRFVALNMGWHRSVASPDESVDPEEPDVSATWAFAVAWTSEPGR
jgi:hypothetical protein